MVAKKKAQAAKVRVEMEQHRPYAIALVSIAAAALFVGFVPFGASQATDWPVIALAAAVATGLVFLPREDVLGAYVRWPLMWAWTGWLAWAVIGTVTAPSLARGLFGVYGSHIGWVTLAAVGFVVISGVEMGAQGRKLLGTAALAIVIVEVLAAVYELSARVHVSGSTSNSTILGQVLVLLLPIALMSLRDRPLLWRATLVAAVFVALLGGYALAATAFLLLWLTFEGARALLRAGWSKLTTVALGVGLWVVAFAGLLLSPLRTAATEFVTERYTLAYDGWLGFLMRPVQGWGPDGYVSGAWQVVTGDHIWGPYALAGVSADPHNALVWILVSTGVVGLALAGWVAFEVVRNWVHQAKAGSFGDVEPFVQGIVLYGALCLIAPAALQSLPIAALVLGASLRVPKPHGEASAVGSSRGARVAVTVFASLVALVLGMSGLTRFVLARVDEPTFADARTTTALADAWGFDPFLYWRSSLDWGFAVQEDPTLAADQPDLVAAKRAVELDPSNPAYAMEYALTLAGYQAEPQAVEEAFTRAAELIPGSPNAWAALAQYRLAKGDQEGAREMLDRAAELGETIATIDIEATYWREAGNAEKAAEYEAKAQAIRDSGTF